jgi:prepilin peptidase CpaA
VISPMYVALAVTAVACVTDLRTRRVPNRLTITSALAAVLFHTVLSGTAGLTASATGWLVGVAIFFPFFALGGLGAGDVKLLGAIGAWLGPAVVLQVAMYSAMAGGVLGLAIALRAGYARTAFRNVAFLVKYWMTVGIRPAEGLTLTEQRAPKLAYAFPILAGVVVTLWRQ